jgi:hypothetical protein
MSVLVSKLEEITEIWLILKILFIFENIFNI